MLIFVTGNHEIDITMYPFEVKFTRTIKKPYDPNKVKHLACKRQKVDRDVSDKAV